jgi:subtilase family serine protease
MKFRFSAGAMALLFAAISIQTAAAQSARASSPTSQLDVEIPAVVGRSFNLGHANPSQRLHIAVSMPYAKPDEVQAFADSVSDPNSPNYRQFITPEEVGRRFGLSSTKVKSVTDYLKANGFNVTLVGKNRLSILADATVAQAEAAFHTKIDNFQSIQAEAGNKNYFAFTTPLSMPATLAGIVSDVSGLESFTKPNPRALTPTQTRTLYSLAAGYTAGYQGQGRAIAISNWDGYRLSNLPSYYSTFGLPTPSGGVGANVHEVKISGGAGTGGAGGEGDLDIQMVLGMAPLCNFYIYDGGSSDLIGVLTRETNDNIADVISESYGWNLGTTTANAAHNLHLSMTTQGITYMAASGDSGTTIEPYSYPNYDPEVLMVGGTVATVNGSGVRSAEVGWSGSGGGYSTKAVSWNVLPSWQTGNGVPTTLNYRLGPDVALHAAGSGTGAYQFVFNGSLTSGYIGTSFACPVFAGSLGAAEQQIIAQGGLPADGSGKQRFGRIQNLVYGQNGRSDVWFDITSGNNGNLANGSSSSAHAGWDTVTGWGAINFAAFVTSQAPTVPPVPTGVAAVAADGSVTVSWNASAGATSYKVKRSTTSGSGYSIVGSPTGTSYVDGGLTNGTTYYYVVTAVNSTGQSANSSEVSATPQSNNIISNPDFELGNVGWVNPNGAITNDSAQAAHSGTWKAWMAGRGVKSTMTLYQQITVPTTVTVPTVTFWLHIDTKETVTVQRDTFKVVLRDSAGVLLKSFTTFNNLMAAPGFQQYTFSLKRYKGQTVRLSFESKENGVKPTSFVVDDVVVNSH